MGIYNSSLKNDLDNEESIYDDKEIIHENRDNIIHNESEKGEQDVEEKIEENININEFNEYDENNDGKITWEEFDKHFENKFGRKMDRNDLWEFLAKDSDGDTSVSFNEWKLYHDRRYGYD